MNNINFKGGYYIEKAPIRLWHKVQKDLISKGAVIKNFEDNNDKFIILDKCFDDEMVNYLTKKRFNFCFYPNVANPKHNINYTDSMVKNIIEKNQDSAITTKDDMLKYISDIANKSVNKGKQLYKWAPNDYVNKTKSFLNIPEDRCHVVTENGATVFYKKKKGDFLSNYDIESMEKIASASPNDENGVNYVYIYPKIYGEPTKRYALDIYGKIVAEYEHSDFKVFYANFVKNIQLEKKRIKQKV